MKIDILDDNYTDAQEAWKPVEDLCAAIVSDGESLFAANTGLIGENSLAEGARHELLDLNALIATHNADDPKGLAALEKRKEPILERIASYQNKAALNNKRGAVKRAFGPRLKLFRRENPHAIPISAPVLTEKKPDKAIILDCRKQGESFAKQVEAARLASLPMSTALARMERSVDGDTYWPDISAFVSRKRDADDWTSASLTPENVLGMVLCLIGDEAKGKFREKIERHYEARGDGLSNQQIAEKIESINKEWLAVQRLEHSHMKGFAAQGLDLTWNSKLSIFVAGEFRVEGITALHGKHGHMEEGW